MSVRYSATFTSGDPRLVTGLSPTFIIFQTATGATLAPPSITETIAGTGIYGWSYAATLAIQFCLDGGSSVSDSSRYLTGVLDPVDQTDVQIGNSVSSFGDSSTDPSTLFGFAKRVQEFQEGNATYNKSTLTWDVYSRGSSTLLVEKTLSNTSSTASKS
jgi:hypothetical protein